MPDVSSKAPADVRLWVALDVHKFSIVAATLPRSGGAPEVQRIETTAKAIRRFIERLGGPEGLALAYEAGPGGFDLLRVLASIGVACDVIAPSLVPVRAGDRVKTDRRDAKKLVRLLRAGELSFVAAPDTQTEGLRDLMRAREDLRCARTAARHRVAKALLRHGRIYREGKKAWTQRHRAWVQRQRLEDPLAQLALEQMLVHLEGLDRQLTRLDADLERIAAHEPWAQRVDGPDGLPRHRHQDRARADRRGRRLPPLRPPARARLVARHHAERVLLRRPATPRPHHNRHARRLLVEAAWHYRHRPRRSNKSPEPSDRAWQAQIRLHRRWQDLTGRGKRPTVATVAIARELSAFLWAELTDQPARQEAAA